MKHVAAIFTVVVLFLTGCQSMVESGRTITANGSGSVAVVPDIATFVVQVEETCPTTSEALAKANAKTSQVLSALKGEGVQTEDIATSGIRLAPSYEWEENHRVFKGQSSSQSLSVKVRDLDVLGTIIDQLGMIDGISLESVAFDKENKSEAYALARSMAVKDAYEKALAYARPLGLRVARTRSINESGSGVMGMRNAMFATESMKSTPVESGVMALQAEVVAVFEIK